VKYGLAGSISIFDNPEPQKADPAIHRTEAGREMDFKLMQPENVAAAIRRSFEPGSKMTSRT
jgi:hypothetical protein